jgi:hypothetical protein
MEAVYSVEISKHYTVKKPISKPPTHHQLQSKSQDLLNSDTIPCLFNALGFDETDSSKQRTYNKQLVKIIFFYHNL